MRVAAVLVFLVLLALAYYSPAHSDGSVLLVRINGEIDYIKSQVLSDALATASAQGCRLVVVELDTVGGGIEYVRRVVELFESSPVPVCVYVYPSGAIAFRLGTYVLMAAHIAAMAPDTVIGLSRPLHASAEVINALSDFMTTRARLHCRNETAARLMVTEGLKLKPHDALRNHVVELVASDLSKLLSSLENATLVKFRSDGEVRWKLIFGEGTVEGEVLHAVSFSGISSASVIEYVPNFGLVLLSYLSNPIIYVFVLATGLALFVTGIVTKREKITEYAAWSLVILVCLPSIHMTFWFLGLSVAAVLLLVLASILAVVGVKREIKPLIAIIVSFGILMLSLVLSFDLAILALGLGPVPSLEELERARWATVAVSAVMVPLLTLLVYKVVSAKSKPATSRNLGE